MASSEEILFGQTRHKLKDEINEFVLTYIQEAKVQIVGISVDLAGRVLGHTLLGHDLSLEYDFEDSLVADHKEHLGIRIRHENWRPKVTIWSRKSIMETFFADQLNEAIKEKIKDCIDKTITQR